MSSRQPQKRSTRNQLTPGQKSRIFTILKNLFGHPDSLHEGKEVQEWCDGKTLELGYWPKKCKVTILDSQGKIECQNMVPTEEIYFRWRDGVAEENLSPEDLQRVQNDLTLMGIQSNEVTACFSLAKTSLIQEFQCLQANATLKIVCDGVAVTFASGKGENRATVLYDKNRDRPMYSINVLSWWMRTGRWVWLVLCGIGAVFGKLIDILFAVESFLKTAVAMMKTLTPMIRSLHIFIQSKLPSRQKTD